MNPVTKRIWELACFGYGRWKKIIRKVGLREMIPDQRYAWLLYSSADDADLVDAVVLDVSRAQAKAIDLQVRAHVDRH